MKMHNHHYTATITRSRMSVRACLTLVIGGMICFQVVQAEKLYRWVDKDGQTHITSNYPSVSLVKKGTKVKIIDTEEDSPGKVVIKKNTLSESEIRRIAANKKKRGEIKLEITDLEKEKEDISIRLRKLKTDLKLMNRQDDIDSENVDPSELKSAPTGRADDIKAINDEISEKSSRLRTIELRLFRLGQELENL